MAHTFLKTAVVQHTDISRPVKVFWVRDGKAMLYSDISDKTFEVPSHYLNLDALNPDIEYSEHVIDIPAKNTVFSKPTHQLHADLFNNITRLIDSGISASELEIHLCYVVNSLTPEAKGMIKIMNSFINVKN